MMMVFISSSCTVSFHWPFIDNIDFLSSSVISLINQENNVPTKEKECESNIDGLKGHSILFEESHAISEEEVKFEKRSSGKSRPQKKMDPKRRKYEKTEIHIIFGCFI
ncbi:hypothetical protein MtrunA17_Chr1g0157551 [Medicago truncatula]|uniref:Uncharacterized protein n=1 Tax=Medicago truncatula TaxID=3880 RepID=A0A072VFQ8_MEDTR|nr:hypothetical protein MTR_1g026700 [Medicago truncatula]RHN77696.1 hypothetical protein MtrunA17_Chr1g0157551 [Medicago truncatula]